jgi:cytochrome c oxidase cbb3-type subunit III
MKSLVIGIILVMVVFITQRGFAQNDALADRELFKSNCLPCHGESGKGDGPAGQVLPVRPANLAGRITTNGYSDQYLFEVIDKGGASVGKSNHMPAWSGALSDKQIRELVSFLRTLNAPANPSPGKK